MGERLTKEREAEIRAYAESPEPPEMERNDWLAAPRELRPYGPGGADVCAGCVLGKDAPAERLMEAERQLGARLMGSEPLVLDAEEQVGPRPSKSKGVA